MKYIRIIPRKNNLLEDGHANNQVCNVQIIFLYGIRKSRMFIRHMRMLTVHIAMQNNIIINVRNPSLWNYSSMP